MNNIQSWLVRLSFPGAAAGEPGKHRFCVAGVMTDEPDADDQWSVDTATGSVAPAYCVDCLGDLGQAEQVYGPGALKCMQCGSVFKCVER
ncbi:hypothetical protein [Rhodoferax sp.]|uniref:hypothetical protein n=1 Tax=Rhodoferax sp. TaxID=50421 RepID=UPI00260F8604|nr:hypothetical protein [Rhodoferax sp.]MDD3934897.1 hypothetical protein [Rhodoferax sp.]